MKLLFLNQSRDKVSEAWLRKWVRAMPKVLADKKAVGRVKLPKTLNKKEIVVVLVSSGEMKRLNHLYRGKNYATDVLSFESADPTCLGELVLCVPVIRAQGKRTGLGERGELGYMIVHGVLHLLGYDHMETKDQAQMFQLQDRAYGVLEAKIGLR
jgi:probable rRNA maturation factor